MHKQKGCGARQPGGLLVPDLVWSSLMKSAPRQRIAVLSVLRRLLERTSGRHGAERLATASAHAAPEVHPALKVAFDTEFYLAEYADVTAARIDPLVHFLDYGWREGRRPCRDFDTEYYLRANPDIASDGINPFLHYLLIGKREGRRACEPPPPEQRRVLKVKAPRERIADGDPKPRPELSLTAVRATLEFGRPKRGACCIPEPRRIHAVCGRNSKLRRRRGAPVRG